MWELRPQIVFPMPFATSDSSVLLNCEMDREA